MSNIEDVNFDIEARSWLKLKILLETTNLIEQGTFSRVNLRFDPQKIARKGFSTDSDRFVCTI